MADIRFAREDDFAGLANLEERCFSDPWSEAAFAAFSETGGVLLVREEEGALQGYVSARFAADEGEIANVATSPDCRRQGIASQLLDAVEKEAALRGANKLFLEVRVSNEAAVALYEKKGYVPAGVRKDFYQHPKEDAFIYRKDLV